MNAQAGVCQEIRLGPGQIHRIEAQAGTCIKACEGLLWLTVSNSREDHFLSANQTYRLERKAILLIEAAGTGGIAFSISHRHYLPRSWTCRLWRAAMGVWPVQRLKARWKALGSEKPSRYATSPSARR